MKNPFKKEDNTALVIGVVAGAVTAGIAAYLYLTESGVDTRKKIADKLKEGAKDIASELISKKTRIHKRSVKKVADHFVKS